MKYTLLALTFVLSLSSYAEDTQTPGGAPSPKPASTIEEAPPAANPSVSAASPTIDPKTTEALFLGQPGSDRCTKCEERMQKAGKVTLGGDKDPNKSPQARRVFVPGSKKKKKKVVTPTDQNVEQ